MTGRKAIASGRPLWKYADEIDGARAITPAEAREISAVDPSLVYAKECTHHDCRQSKQICFLPDFSDVYGTDYFTSRKISRHEWR